MRIRIRLKPYFAGLAVLSMTMPVWARTYKESLVVEKRICPGFS
jgi:hypothetical protein